MLSSQSCSAGDDRAPGNRDYPCRSGMDAPRIRKRLVDILEGHGIAPDGPQVPVSRAVRGRLYSIDIAAEEIRPKHMKGFGKVSDTAIAELDRIADDLQQTARNLDKTMDEKIRMDL